MENTNGSLARKTLRNLSDPLELREINRQMDWIWKQLLGGLDLKSFSTNGVTRIAKKSEDIIANDVDAENVETNFLSAQIAKLAAAAIGVVDAEYADILDIQTDSLLVRIASGQNFFLEHLMVRNAQMLNATIGNLILQSSDGRYFQLDIDDEGKVSTTEIIPSQEEIEKGYTDSGKVIMGTTILADDISTTNIGATLGLFDKIIAQRIEVDTLIARDEFVTALFAAEAFIDLLRTTKIVGEKSIEMIAETADSTRDDFSRVVRIDGDGLHVGDNQSNSEALIDSDGFNTVVNGQRYSKLASNYVQFGNYQLRQSADGGLVFKLKED